MKIPLVTILCSVSLLVLGCEDQPVPSVDQEESLPDAVAAGLVGAQFEGTGGASGDVMLLRVRRTVARTLSITVPLGLVVDNTDASEQDMIVRRLAGEDGGGDGYSPVDSVLLTDDGEHEYVLEAYCLEAHKDNPSSDSSLRIGEAADSDVLAVLAAIDQTDHAEGNVKVIQAAVWAITDDITLDELEEVGYELSSDDVETARELIEVGGLDPESYRLFG